MRGKCTVTERHPAPTLQWNVRPQNIWSRHHQTHMPFHAAINRSEGAFWFVGVLSHIFISTAINAEESGATATKGNTNIYCSTLPAKGRNNTNRIIGCTNTRNIHKWENK
ncbi:putative mucin TcMUCII [Trypanosoma cruzi]|nr:putative mucin TcMUCII [Trypanosoma cruzi]